MITSKDFIPQLDKLADLQDLRSSDQLYNEVTASYAYWNGVLAKLKCLQAIWHKNNNIADDKGKYPSVASLEKDWKATEEGLKMIKLKAEVDNLKAVSKAVDSHLFTLRAEAKLAQ